MYLKTLIWKDFRNHQRFLIAAGVFLLLPHLVAAAATIVNQIGPHAVPEWEWVQFFWGASLADLGIAALLTAFIAGNAIAGERADRSAEFTAYLPIQRKDAITSKAIVALGISVGLIAVCAGITFAVAKLGHLRVRAAETAEVGVFIGTTAIAFGTAWLVSSFARSATYAAAAGVVVPFCIAITLGVISETEAMAHVHMGTVYFVTCMLIAPTSFIAGIVYYLRRVEP